MGLGLGRNYDGDISTTREVRNAEAEAGFLAIACDCTDDRRMMLPNRVAQFEARISGVADTKEEENHRRIRASEKTSLHN